MSLMTNEHTIRRVRVAVAVSVSVAGAVSVARVGAGEQLRAKVGRRVVHTHSGPHALPTPAERVVLQHAAEEAEQTEDERSRAEHTAERDEEELLGRRAARPARTPLEPRQHTRRAALRRGHRSSFTG